MSRRGRLARSFAGWGLVFGLTTGGRGQEPPPLAAGPTYTADRIIQDTLRASPGVLSAAASLSEREAVLQEARGAFDRLARAQSRLNYGVAEVIADALVEERKRRIRLEVIGPLFDGLAQGFVEGIPSEGQSLFIRGCTRATSFLTVENADGTFFVICFDSLGRPQGVLGLDIDPAKLKSFRVVQILSDLFGLGPEVQEVVDFYEGLLGDLLRSGARDLRLGAFAAREARRKLGRLPEESETINFDLSVDHAFRLRTGAAVLQTLSLQSSELNFRGKRLDPLFGDAQIPNSFVATAGLGLDVPLGRGAGRRAVTAGERAAEEGLKAAHGLLAHAASTGARASLDAYWETIAAKRRVELLEASAATQERILEASEELVRGEVLPQVDLARTRARLAQVRAQAATARQALIEARLRLQRAMGLDGANLAEAPAPGEGFEAWPDPDPVGQATAEQLIAHALAHRGDLQARQALTEANRILADAAKVNLRPDVRLRLNLSYSALHDSFRDRFYDFEGFQRAIQGKIAGPSYSLGLRFEFPFGNNAAQGRLVQAEARTARSQVEGVDLARDIRLRVHEFVATVARARAELASRREALAQFEETHRGAMERFQAGDLNLIDALTTEEQLTQARIELVEAERRLLSLAAALRFETGSLLEYPEGEPLVLREVRLAPLTAPIS